MNRARFWIAFAALLVLGLGGMLKDDSLGGPLFLIAAFLLLAVGPRNA